MNAIRIIIPPRYINLCCKMSLLKSRETAKYTYKYSITDTLCVDILEELDLLYVREGIKPCARIFSGPRNDGLSWVRGNVHIKPEPDVRGLAFSNRGIVAEDGFTPYYAAIDTGIAEKARAAEEIDDHEALGLSLGYPSCCVNFYRKHRTEEPLLLHEGKGNHLINYCLRYFGIAIISHFPCSPDCTESIRIAKERLKIIQARMPEYAKRLTALKCFCLITDKLVLYATEYERRDDAIELHNPVSTAKEAMHSVRIVAPGKYMINKRIHSGSLYFFN
jgi:hypothetical protein